jgi:Transposase DDE domain
MNKKCIKAHIRNQLKQEYPGWDKLNKKKRKAIAREILMEVKGRYESGELVPVSIEDQLNIQPIPENMMTIDQMEAFIEMKQKSYFKVIGRNRKSYLDPEKRVIDELLHDEVLNGLLSGPGYTPSKRIKTTAMLFRAELLKSLDYAEMSYRKFCRLEINDMERKKNRRFIGLSLRQKQIISHSELSMFRSSLTYGQQLNLMVYILTLFKQAGFFNGKVFHGVDGTDLAAKLNSHPIDSIEVSIAGKKEKLSIYNHLDVDCGERRTKSDKSKFFVGYKIHTLSVIDAESVKAYPLISLLAPANHHDSNFLSPLLVLGKSLGLDIRLVITDQGYDGTDVDFMDKHDITVISQSQTKMSPLDHVETSDEALRVYMSGDCETPMEYIGREGSNHEFRCNASIYSCPFSTSCPRSRIIPVDNGLFGVIPKVIGEVSKLENMRKVIERPFNLLKHRNGVDRITVKSRQSAQTVLTISTIAVLLIEIAGYRKEKKTESNQVELPLAAA